MIKNYTIFEKHLAKISSVTVRKFKGLDNILKFVENLSESGNVIVAAKKVSFISPLYLYRIINSDKALNKCVAIALQLATDKAEGILYDRAINGYEELSYDKDGQIISRKQKYCSKSLLEYLKANSVKYKESNKSSKIVTKDSKKEKEPESVNVNKL